MRDLGIGTGRKYSRASMQFDERLFLFLLLSRWPYACKLDFVKF